MALIPLARGKKLIISRWVPGDEVVKEKQADYSLGCPDVSPQDKELIIKSLGMMALNVGYPNNPQKFKHVENGIYAIKPTGQLRLLGFKASKGFIIVHCVRKKGGKKGNVYRRRDLEKVIRLITLCKEENHG